MTEDNHSGNAATIVGQPLTDDQIESIAIYGDDADGLMQAANLVDAVATSKNKGHALISILKYRKACRVDAIKSTLSAVRAQGDGWLLIESAPRDGTLVLLGRGAMRCVGSFSNGCWWRHDRSITSDRVNATHWQPLPPPPNAQGAANV